VNSHSRKDGPATIRRFIELWRDRSLRTQSPKNSFSAGRNHREGPPVEVMALKPPVVSVKFRLVGWPRLDSAKP
jgi:hypothetical protein